MDHLFKITSAGHSFGSFGFLSYNFAYSGFEVAVTQTYENAPGSTDRGEVGMAMAVPRCLLLDSKQDAVSPVRYRRRGSEALLASPFFEGSFNVNHLQQGRPPAAPECTPKPTRRAQVKVGGVASL